MTTLYLEKIMHAIVRTRRKVSTDTKHISSIDDYISLIYFFTILTVKNKARKKLDNKTGPLIYFRMQNRW